MVTRKKLSVIIFDVNETLLDMKPLKQAINRQLEHPKAFRVWINMLLHYSLVESSIGEFHDFSKIADATLDMAASALNVKITAKNKKLTLAHIIKLKPFPEVKKNLRALKEKGFRLATLSNSSQSVLNAQLKYAGLDKYFEKNLSVEQIKKYKPFPETYTWACTELKVDTVEAMLVAVHGWDVTGAMKTGMNAAFVERKGQSLYSLVSPPDIKGKDISEVAKKIIRKYS